MAQEWIDRVYFFGCLLPVNSQTMRHPFILISKLLNSATDRQAEHSSWSWCFCFAVAAACLLLELKMCPRLVFFWFHMGSLLKQIYRFHCLQPPPDAGCPFLSSSPLFATIIDNNSLSTTISRMPFSFEYYYLKVWSVQIRPPGKRKL